jgi:hypothetical protein
MHSASFNTFLRTRLLAALLAALLAGWRKFAQATAHPEFNENRAHHHVCNEAHYHPIYLYPPKVQRKR